MIHQMWVKGAFNRLIMNQCNSSPELMGAKLHGSMNGTVGEMVDSTEINKKVRELQQAKREQNRNVEKKTQEIANYFCSKPTKQRQVRTKDQKEQDEERERLAIAVEERARKLREKQEKAAERAAITVAIRAKNLKEKEERASAAAIARARKLKHKEDATAGRCCSSKRGTDCCCNQLKATKEEQTQGEAQAPAANICTNNYCG